MRRILLAAAAALILAPASADESHPPLPVVASMSILGDMVARIGGERARVITIVDANADVHVHSPSPADIRAIGSADLVVVNGLGLDAWMERAIDASGTSGLTLSMGWTAFPPADDIPKMSLRDALDRALEDSESTLAAFAADSGEARESREDRGTEDRDRHEAGEHDEHDEHDEHGHAEDQDRHEAGEHDARDEHGHAEDRDKGDDHEEHHPNGRDHHDHGGVDPHVWQSPLRAVGQASAIAAALSLLDPEGGDVYRKNLTAYRSALEALAEEWRRLAEELPPGRGGIATPHQSFGYLERDFGIPVMAVEGLSTESQASAGDLAALVRDIEAGRITSIFPDNVSDLRMLRQIQREAGVPMGGVLYSDALSASDGPASSHLDLLRHNLLTVSAALAGEAEHLRRLERLGADDLTPGDRRR